MGKTEVRREIVLGGTLYLEPDGLIDWAAVFGRNLPVLIDIGAARARWFLAVGPRLEGVGLVGMEVAKKRVERALEKLEEAGLGERARMVWGNAMDKIRDHVAPGSVAAFTVLFPDPWPKKRHAKRRIFQRPETADLLARRLLPGGLVLLKTDSAAYFGPMREAFAASPLLRETGDLTVRAEGHAPFSLDWPDETKYEEMWRKEGRPLFRAAFRRV